jgi:hypothetical protein
MGIFPETGNLPERSKMRKKSQQADPKTLETPKKKAHAKGNPGRGGAQPGAGRPKKPIPYDDIEAISRLHPSDEEIAGFCGISRNTLEIWKKDEQFQACVERGRAAGKLNLRRKQLAKAEQGDGTMLVWLGKNMLGQADKAEVKHSGQLSVVIDLGAG